MREGMREGDMVWGDGREGMREGGMVWGDGREGMIDVVEDVLKGVYGRVHEKGCIRECESVCVCVIGFV